MTDPLESLRTPVTPVDPDPSFASQLRARAARALALPKGVTVSNLVLELEPEPAAVAPVGVIPYLIVADARRAIAWYVDALGARQRGEPVLMPDGRIGHAELDVLGGVVYLADPSPDPFSGSRVAPPAPGEPARVSLSAQVADIGRLCDRAVAAGADLERAPQETPHGVQAAVVDPFGHRWLLWSPSPTPAREGASGSGGAGRQDPGLMRQGDIAYVSLWVPDLHRAEAFFSRVLGWSYAHEASGSRQVLGQSLSHGIAGGRERGNLFLCFAVDDVDAAVERVWSAGGRVEEPTNEPYGRIAMCVDDQGVAFALFTPPVGRPQTRGPVNGERDGDVSYLTIEVVDSARTRAFYGQVLGWRFSRGRVPDGWGVDGVVPMCGLHGGHDVATVVPMYRVPDIHAAVEEVRAGGGTATDPVVQEYGVTSACTDDQGTRFYLGQD